MLNRGYIVYVERNFSAVLESHYYYHKKAKNYYDQVATENTTLDEYLSRRNDPFFAELAWKWKHTSATWTALVRANPDRMRKVTYMEMAERTNETLARLSQFLNDAPVLEQPGRNWTGVSVGYGKGTQEPSPGVHAVAQRALQAAETLDPTSMYRKGYGTPIASFAGCGQASWAACPERSRLAKFDDSRISTS